MADNGSPIHFRRSHAFDSPRDRESTEDGIAWLLTAHPRAAGPISDVLLAGGEISRWLESGRQVLEALIPGGFCLADADFVPVTWNERFLDILSQTVDLYPAVGLSLSYYLVEILRHKFDISNME